MKRIPQAVELDPKNGMNELFWGTISNAKNDLIDDVALCRASWRYVHANRGPVLHCLPKRASSVGVG